MSRKIFSALVLCTLFTTMSMGVANAQNGTISVYQSTNTCSPMTGTLTVTDYSGAIQYWEYSTNQVTWTKRVTPEPYLDYSITQTTYFRVFIRYNGSDTYSEVYPMTFYPAPAAPTTTSAGRCGPGSVTLSASGSGMFKWFTDASLTILTHIGTSYSPNLNATTTYYVTATNPSGCASAGTPVTATITNFSAGTISLSQNINNCYPRQGTLSLNGYAGTLQRWEYSTDQVSWQMYFTSEADYEFNVTQTTYYRAYVTNNSCTGYSPVYTVTVIPGFSVTGASRCGPGPVTLTATGSGTINWYSNSSLTTLVATGTSYTPTVNATTTYYVTCSAYPCSAPGIPVTATVNPFSAGTISISQVTNNCYPKQGTLTLSGNIGDVFFWEYSTDQVNWTRFHTFSNTFDYSATQTTYYRAFSGNGGCSGNSPVFTLPVTPLPAPATSGASRCGTGSVVLSSITTAPEYVWYNAAGTVLPNTTKTYTTPSLTATTTFYVALKSGTCIGTKSPVTATINPQPAAPSTTSASRCGSGAVTLNASGASSANEFYQWYTAASGGTPIAGQTTATYTVSLSATTTYYVSIRNNSGCESGRTAVTGTISNVVAGSISKSAGSNCTPATGTLTLSGHNGTVVQWESSLNNSNWTAIAGTAGITSYNYSVNQNTYYRARVNLNSCIAYTATTSATTITVVTPPSAPVTSAGSSRCGSGVWTLYATGAAAGQTYRWYNPSGTVIPGITGDSYTANFTTSGTYNVSIVNASGCESQKTPLVFTINPLPSAPAATGGSRTGAGQLTLSASGAGSGQSYQWYIVPHGGSSLASTASFTATFNATTTYYVSLKTPTCESGRTAVTGTVISSGNCNNCIVTRTVLKEGITSVAQLDNLPVEDVDRQTSFVDGFGRQIQKVTFQGSPLKNDVVSIFEYDAMSRQPRTYLPYTAGNNGSFRSNAKNELYNFYTSAANVDTTTSPFAETVFEASSSGIIVEGGAPGTDWKIGSGHTTTILERPNEAAEAVRIFDYDFSTGNITSPGVYMDGDLLVSQTKNEQGINSYVYTDKSGRAVLKKSQVTASENSLTYYVYDAFGQLRAVIQPEGSKELISGGSLSLTAAFIDKWCFIYSYDEWGRQVTHKTPGAEATYVVYNPRNEVVLEQTGELRKNRQWIFSKFDALGREVLSGIYTHPTALAQANMQALVAANNGTGYERRTSSNYAVQHGYTVNESYPALTTSNSEILSVNYFDDYDLDADYTTLNPAFTSLGRSAEPIASYRTLGLPTGSKSKILGSSPAVYLLNTTFYDDRNNRIQTTSDNIHGGRDIVIFKPDFSGTVIETVRYHNAGSNTVYIKEQLNYDHGKRLISATHQVEKNGVNYPAVTLSSSAYNEVGEHIRKKLYSHNNISFAQTLDFSYNIRGWLTAINNATLSDAGDLFGEEIKYNPKMTQSPFNVAARYDGNISEVWWKDAYSNKQQGYSYSYDLAGRLLSARYTARNGIEFSELEGNDEIISYDLNGNIKSLSRFQWPAGATSKQQIDVLAYTYLGNQVKRIDDNAGPYAAAGFVNNASEAEEYIFDANGNLKTDKNKGISSITYNIFNVPTEIVITGKGRILYTYDAAGTKLRKQVIPSSGATITTDYTGGIEYRNNILQFAATGEGRVLLQNVPSYEFAIEDHLGNPRINFDKDPITGNVRIIQKNDYYAYGMAMTGGLTPAAANKYQYNGKELQDELGLNWYDYGARMYDPQIARWNALDAEAEKYNPTSPYNYVLGDPVSLVDPDGNEPNIWVGLRTSTGGIAYRWDPGARNLEEARQRWSEYEVVNVQDAGYTYLDKDNNRVLLKDNGDFEVSAGCVGMSGLERNAPVWNGGRNAVCAAENGNHVVAALAAVTAVTEIVPTKQLMQGLTKAAIRRMQAELWKVGSYQMLKISANKLFTDAHHVGQKELMKQLIRGYNQRNAPAITVPKIGHTIGMPGKGIVSRRLTKADGTPFKNAREVLARDIRELRRVYGREVTNKALRQLINQNKNKYPEMLIRELKAGIK